MSQYDTPKNYSIPNPYGPRLHNWKGGPYNEGSLYHGPIYTRPDYRLPWSDRPLFGVDTTEKKDENLPLLALGTVGMFFLAKTSLDLIFGPVKGRR